MTDNLVPEDPPGPEGPATSDGLKRFSWQWFKLWGKRAVAVLVGIPPVVIGAWIVVGLFELRFQRNTLDIDAMGVPEPLSKAGFTSDVATERLVAEIFAVQDRAQTIMAKTAVETEQELSAIAIPKTGLTLQGVGAILRGLFPRWQKRITGEFTQSGSHVSLQIRLNGRKIFESKAAATAEPDAAGALIGPGVESAAFKIVEQVQPYFAASALYGEGKSDDLVAAEKAADDIIDRFPPTDENVLRALDLKGIIANVRGDYSTAQIYCERALQINPNDAPTHSNLGSIYLGQNKPREALAAYRTAIRLGPTYAQPHAGLANMYYEQHDLEAAVGEYQTAIGLDRTDALLHAGLGLVYRDQIKLDLALAEYHTAVRLDPKNALLHAGLGNVYRDRHEPDAAIDEYRTAINLDPTDPLPHNNLGTVYRAQQKPDAAVAEYQAAIRLGLQNAEIHLNLGNAFSDQEKLDEAINEYQTAIRLSPKSALPHAGLGNAFSDQEKLDAAVEEYQTAVRLAPENALMHCNLGDLYRHQGKLDSAITEYQTCIRISPATADRYNGLGRALVEASRRSEGGDLGRLKDACGAFIAGSKLDPNDPKYLKQMQEIDVMMAGAGHCPA
jgi:tetratricopeptide (TPR) repeat protein